MVTGKAGLKFEVIHLVDLTNYVPRELALKVFPASAIDAYMLELESYKMITIHSDLTSCVLEAGSHENGTAPKLDL